MLCARTVILYAGCLSMLQKKSIGGFTVGNTFSMSQQRHPATKEDKHHTGMYK